MGNMTGSMNPLGAKESGMSLISVMITISVLAVSALLVSKAFVRHKIGQAKMKSNISYLDAYETFQSQLSTGLRNHIKQTNSCNNLSSNIKDLAITGNANMNSTVNPSGHGKHRKHRAAKKRCQLPKSGNSYAYFCVEIDTDTDAPEGSFLNGGPGGSPSFAEVFVKLTNTATNNATKCKNFADKPEVIQDNSDLSTNKSQTLGIHYTIYWNVKSNSKSMKRDYFSRSGHYYAR